MSTRRRFLGAMAGTSALSALQAQSRTSPLDGVKREKLRITDVKVTSLAYRLKPEEEWPDSARNSIIWKTESVIVEVATDSGLKGIGAASRYNGPAEMKAYLDGVVRPLLVGKSPFDVESLAAGISGSGARGIWSGVDTAMWDIIARSKGLPLYKLLATDTEPQTHLRMYASGGEYTWLKNSRFPGPDDLLKQALRHKAAGYTAFKFRPGGAFERFSSIRELVPYLREIRKAVGPNFDLIQESNCRWTMEQCLEIAPVLEELKFTWWEEPMRRNIDDYVKLKKSLTSVKISGGEGLATRSALVDWMDRGAYDVVQPGCDDAGVTECWHMARMAATRGKLICPHNWQDGLVCLANAHLMAAVPNRFMLESNMTPNPFKEGLFKEKFAAVNGYIDVPNKPGLGVELREGLAELYPPLPGNWNRPDPDMPGSGA